MMIPFSDFMYPDKIQVSRASFAMSGGRKVTTYLAAEPIEMASVQSDRITRVDPDSGVLTTATIHTVRTPGNRSIKPDDKIVWIDDSGETHALIAVGSSTPKGIGDVQYMTECRETD